MIRTLAREIRAFFLRPSLRYQERILTELGRMQARELQGKDLKDLRQAEFQVFSQHGEDGILQYLLSRVPIASKTFVEFGVQDYSESNTRFLISKDHWAGLIIDAGDEHLKYVHGESWLGMDRDLKAMKAYITRDNINALLADMPEDLGLLSIDIDGNDYWILKAISKVKPRVLVLEYNAHFGPSLSLTLPYAERFDRKSAHASGYYFGASLKALTELASEKGYALVGCESHGGNAFYVRKDVLSGLPEKSVEEAYVPMAAGGGLSYPKTLKAIAKLSLQDPKSSEIKTISEWFKLGPS